MREHQWQRHDGKEGGDCPAPDHRDGREPGKDPTHDQRPPRIRKEPVGTWLVLRYDLGDSGLRPIPTGEIFYASPDIWITGGDAFGNAIAGKPTTVHARVWNFGTFHAVPTRVEFRFVDPSMGIPWTAPQKIGVAWVSVPPLSTAIATCPVPWIPAPSGSVHACLIVTCASPPMDPADKPGNVIEDRKTAQRNVTIVAADPGATLEFELMMGRVSERRGLTEIVAFAAFGNPDPARLALATRPMTRTLQSLARATDPRTMRLLARRALALRQAGGEDDYRPLKAEELGRQIAVKGDFGKRAARRTEARMMGQAQAVGGDLPEGFVRLAATDTVEPLTQQRVAVAVKVPRGKAPFILNLVQLEDGVPTGGYALIARPRRE